MKKYLVGVVGLALAAGAVVTPASAHGLDLDSSLTAKAKAALEARHEDDGILKTMLRDNVIKNNWLSEDEKRERNINAAIHLKGDVTAASSGSLSVSSDGKVWVVSTAGAKLLNKGATLADIKVGHKVSVVGKAATTTNGSLSAMLITDLSLRAEDGKKHDKATSTATSSRKSVVSGIVSDVDSALKTLTVTRKNGEEVKVAINNDTNVRLNLIGVHASGTASSSASSTVSTGSIWDLLDGAKVQIKGMLDKATNTITAIKIFASARINL